MTKPTSSFLHDTPPGLHVAIIMDGNGRWARARGRPREWGHRHGAEAVRRTVEAAPDLGIGVLTLYAFSSDNWSRPAREIRTIMRLFRRYLSSEARELADEGVRLQVIGRRDRLSPGLHAAIEAAEATTARGSRLLLRLAVDYSSRDQILRWVRGEASLDDGTQRKSKVDALIKSRLGDLEIGSSDGLSGPGALDVDLLIRTGGEQRLSDFLLWECAYAELLFLPVMWPDFDASHLSAAIEEFERRERRFGGVPATA